MFQGNKIYYDDRVIILSTKITKSFEKNEGLFFKYTGKKEDLIDIIDAFQHFKSIDTLHILSDNEEILWEQIKSCYTIVEAAGGIVKRPDGKYFAIFRRGKWDLPKGKVEVGEFYKHTALREVKEECGFKNIDVNKKLFDTYHTYLDNGKTILKRTMWYEMTLNENEEPVLQAEEGITDMMWFDYENVSEIMKNTYESLKDLFIVIITPQ